MFWPTQSRITNINYEFGSKITTYNWPFAKRTEASSKIAELSLFNALLFMIMLAYYVYLMGIPKTNQLLLH